MKLDIFQSFCPMPYLHVIFGLMGVMAVLSMWGLVWKGWEPEERNQRIFIYIVSSLLSGWVEYWLEGMYKIDNYPLGAYFSLAHWLLSSITLFPSCMLIGHAFFLPELKKT